MKFYKSNKIRDSPTYNVKRSTIDLPHRSLVNANWGSIPGIQTHSAEITLASTQLFVYCLASACTHVMVSRVCRLITT